MYMNLQLPDEDIQYMILFFLLVVGEKEKTNGTVNVRTRDNKVHGEASIEEVIKKFKELAEKRILKSEETWN